MTVQKFINYKILNKDGTILNYESENKFELKIIEKSSNYLIHKDILRHQIHNKQGTISTKVKSEVRGGGRKPWRQKGTGRARAGSNRSPLWKGGGVIFGPKPKKVISKLNKKERRLALQTLLYNKKNSVFVIDNLENEVNLPKTKIFIKICQDCGINLDEKLLIIVSEKTKLLKLSTQNIKNVELISASSLNTLSLMKAKQIILTPLAVNDIKEIFCD
jgi:large subunit ribosomal protein L4